MTGQYNTMDLAGVSMATSIWNPFFTFLTGIVSALVPIIGHHLGTGKRKKLHLILPVHLSGLGLSVVLLGMVLFLAPPVLNHIGLEAPVAAVAVHYLWFLSIGLSPYCFLVSFVPCWILWLDQTVYVPHAFVTSLSIADLTIS